MGLKDNWVTTDELMKAQPDHPDYHPYEPGWDGERLLKMKGLALKALAKALDGVNATNPEDYLSVTASPRTTDVALRQAMLKMSGCALTSSGLWRSLGIHEPLMMRPYKVSHAVQDLVRTAQAHKAWVPSMKLSLDAISPFMLGDVVLITPPEHVYTIVSVPEPFGKVRKASNGGEEYQVSWVCDALHGGRRLKTGEQLMEVTPTIHTYQNGRWIVTGGSKATGVAAAPRHVMGLCRTFDIPLTAPAHLPPGWDKEE